MNGLKIIVLEGFEMTGKSTMINMLKTLFEQNYKYQCYYYHPNYTIYDKFYESRNMMWLNGITIYDFIESNLKELKDQNICILIDRGVASSLVYSKLTSGRYYSEYDNLINSYNSMKSITDRTTVILMEHRNKNLAEKIYRKGSKRPDNESRDYFDSFDDYYKRYLQYTEEYKKVLSMINYSELLVANII